jgi:hypothetical protein
MTQLEPVMYPAAAHTTAGRDGAYRRARRIVLATWAAAAASGLVLLAAPCDAQTSTQQETSVAQTDTATGASRPFRVDLTEAALVDLITLYWLTNTAASSAQLYPARSGQTNHRRNTTHRGRSSLGIYRK